MVVLGHSDRIFVLRVDVAKAQRHAVTRSTVRTSLGLLTIPLTSLNKFSIILQSYQYIFGI